MQRFSVILLLTGLVAHSPVFAQKIEDVIYLKNGETVRGTIIEQNPGESLKIQTADGSVFEFTIYEIAEISREPVMKVEEGFIKTREKKPWLASGLSFMIPGAGQFYNDQYEKGLPQLGVALAGAGLVWWGLRDNWETHDSYEGQSSLNPLQWVDADGDDWTVFIGAPLWLASSIWSVIDANRSAHRINQEGQQPALGHLLELGGDRAALGVDPVVQRTGSGLRLVLHF